MNNVVNINGTEFDRMLKEHNYKKPPTWQTGQEVFDWWTR